MSDAVNPQNSVHIRHAIWRMFRDPADQDYLIARFSARSNLVYPFWWNAQQAIEKYLKAILLLNGYPTTAHGHRLGEMLDITEELAGALLPVILSPPNFAPEERGLFSKPSRFIPTRSFVARVEDHGNPNNRYRIMSTVSHSEDLVCFDQLCFCLRRLAYPLDKFVKEFGVTAREYLQKNPISQIHPKMGFDDNFSENRKEVWEQHFKWCNFAYFYDEALAEGIYPNWGGAVNSETSLALRRTGEIEKKSFEWVIENSFPKFLRKEIRDEIERIENGSNG